MKSRPLRLSLYLYLISPSPSSTKTGTGSAALLHVFVKRSVVWHDDLASLVLVAMPVLSSALSCSRDRPMCPGGRDVFYCCSRGLPDRAC